MMYGRLYHECKETRIATFCVQRKNGFRFRGARRSSRRQKLSSFAGEIEARALAWAGPDCTRARWHIPSCPMPSHPGRCNGPWDQAAPAWRPPHRHADVRCLYSRSGRCRHSDSTLGRRTPRFGVGWSCGSPRGARRLREVVSTLDRTWLLFRVEWRDGHGATEHVYISSQPQGWSRWARGSRRPRAPAPVVQAGPRRSWPRIPSV
jgi:hypothetical protein